MTVLTDTFSADTGQLTSFLPNVISGASPWTLIGTGTITGGQLALSAPFAGSSSIGGLVIAENSWPVSAPSVTVTARLGTPTWSLPLGPSGSAHFGPGLIKDALNFVCLEAGPDQSTTTLTMFVFANIAGVATVFSGNTPLSGGVLPDAIGFGLVNNDITIYLSFGGVWQLCTSFGSAGHVDISGTYDFTAGGALTGWKPGLIWGQINVSPGPVNIACSQLQFAQPFINPVTGGITVPNVVNTPKATAENIIHAANLTVGVESFVSSTAPVGYVISQNPAAGTVVAFDSPVNLVISAGLTNKNIYGKFVGSLVFPPTLLIDATGIKPRVYAPKENITVKT